MKHLPLLLLFPHFTQSKLSHHLFPPNDEYEFMNFNPETLSGAPYGGFSRATSSRLASLPLRIIGHVPEIEEDSSPHISVHDHNGREFACRSYKKEKLSKESIKESVFDLALEYNMEENDLVEMDDVDSALEKFPSNLKRMTFTSEELKKLFDKLKGTCSQLHLGWWSYEWCYHDRFIQFHLGINDENHAKITVEDVITLGAYTSELMNIVGDDEDNLVSMEESYSNGDKCEDAGRRRSVRVVIQCCGNKWDEMAKQRKFMNIMTNKDDTESVKAQLLSVEEEQTCKYKAVVCVPDICVEEIVQAGTVRDEMKRRNQAGLISIRELLKASLAGDCLVKQVGWWSYKLCQGNEITQYHAHTTLDPSTGNTKTTIQSKNLLGVYSEPVYPVSDEHLHIVNTTIAPHYVENYIHGDVCDHTDVTEAAVTGGNVAGGGIERSATMRYSCGAQRALLNINEDSTCHYMIDVSLPELCDNKLFKEEVLEEPEHVIKCVPVGGL